MGRHRGKGNENMIRPAIAVFWLCVPCLAQAPKETIRAGQASHGACSPNITSIGGNVTIRFSGNACIGIDPKTITAINQFLAKFPEMQARILKLVNGKGALEAQVKEAEQWAQKCAELIQG